MSVCMEAFGSGVTSLPLLAETCSSCPLKTCSTASTFSSDMKTSSVDSIIRAQEFDLTLDRNKTNQDTLSVCWEPSASGWIKRNSDASIVQQGLAACGGILRNQDGNFICSFACNLGSCSIMQAQLWGILKGIKLAKSRGFNRISTDSESLSAVKIYQWWHSSLSSKCSSCTSDF
ncbi:hypothetical protein RJT34_02774 [Clitoria ternatea]|uniref:RNase H type-1 domain-containing protein n=1 Tax=Clitoria ternatea TaxID=43366 RepID=A0AAN9KJJ3_CLITE